MTISPPLFSGILPVDKPEGCTSHDIVSRTRRLLGIKKIGHAGTLDPFATGLLILLVGEGTKLSNALMDGSKQYIAEIMVGEKTDTGDCTGTVIETKPFCHLNEDAFKSAIDRFVGTIKQKPPMYSAVKKNGQPLYKLARKGIEVERDEREVLIENIEILSFTLPTLSLRISCSKGTYIRTLAESISEAAGTCGHLSQLRRVQSGSLSVENAITYEELENADMVAEKMVSLNDSIPLMPSIVVEKEAAKRIRDGHRIIAKWIKDVSPHMLFKGEKAKVVDIDGRLLSIVEAVNEFRIDYDPPPDFIVGKSLRVFNTVSV